MIFGNITFFIKQITEIYEEKNIRICIYERGKNENIIKFSIKMIYRFLEDFDSIKFYAVFQNQNIYVQPSKQSFHF